MYLKDLGRNVVAGAGFNSFSKQTQGPVAQTGHSSLGHTFKMFP